LLLVKCWVYGITIEFTSNDTEKNAPVLTPNELKRLGDGKINISAFSVKNGVTSSTSTSSFTLDTVDPTFDQQQPTTVDILSNTPITTTIYDAQATDGGNADADITYSIKGVNADKFSITTDTGILSSKPSPLTSPAEETVVPLRLLGVSPLITKPCTRFFIDTVMDFFTLLPARSVAIIITVSSCFDVCFSL
jgi:hypothetical protein